MKKTNWKIAISIIAILMVLELIATGVVIALLSYRYAWNTRLDMPIYVPQDVKLVFEGAAGNDTFTSIADEGSFDKSSWQISQSETTFTKTKSDIQITLKFVNKCASTLSITISGIHFDQEKRFDTYLTDGQDQIIDPSNVFIQADGTGEYTFLLAAGLDQEAVVNLNYKHIEKTVPIEGDENDQQILTLSIDRA